MPRASVTKRRHSPTPKADDLGHFKSAESKARALANLTGQAVKGEVRRRPLRHGRPTVEDRRAEIQTHVESRLGSVPPSSAVRMAADLLAQVQVQADLTSVSIDRAISLTSVQASRKLEQQTKVLRLQADANAQLEQALDTCLKSHRSTYRGKPIRPRSDPEHAAQVLILLGAAGALGPEAQAVAEATPQQQFVKDAVRRQQQRSARGGQQR
jgi:hypothetical protein